MADYGSLPFAEQITFFKGQLELPTERWDDLLGAAHDRAFVVAGATSADLLADLHAAVRKGIEDGTTLAEFRRDFDAIVAARGWTGFTGSDSAAGIAWRTRVIYETNLRTSYAAGRWQQLQEVKADRPYLEYRHSESVLSPRPLHQAWDGLVLAADDPWWQTHYPPNGWGCKCRVFALSERDLKRLGKDGPDQAPEDGVRDWKDSRGVVHQVPNGIDPGWDYAPGASLGDDFIKAKAATLPGPLAADFKAAMATRPVFVAQPTAADAARWAMAQDLADRVDYQGIDPVVANAFNQALLEHVSRFPEIRDSLQFVGSHSAWSRAWRELQVARRVAALAQVNPSVDVRKLRSLALREIPLGGPMAEETWARSVTARDLSGIEINDRWGADAAEWLEDIAAEVAAGWHPAGTAAIRAVADHEFAHRLDRLLHISDRPEVTSLLGAGSDIRQGLSEYAERNAQEFVAEAWTEYLNSPSPRPLALTIGGLVERLYADFVAASGNG